MTKTGNPSFGIFGPYSAVPKGDRLLFPGSWGKCGTLGERSPGSAVRRAAAASRPRRGPGVFLQRRVAAGLARTLSAECRDQPLGQMAGETRLNFWSSMGETSSPIGIATRFGGTGSARKRGRGSG